MLYRCCYLTITFIRDSINMAVCFDLTGLNFEHSWLSGQWIDEWTRNDSCGTQFKSDRSLIAARPPGFHQQETTDVEQLWWRETRCKPRCRFIQWLQKASSRPVRLIVMSLPLRHLTSLLAYAEGCREVFYCSTLLRLVGKPPLTNTSSFSASPSTVEVLEDQLHPCPIWIWLPLCF